ncbi:MAG: hypothetical protein AAFO17_17445 [Pseudomonadota bacterium]
MPLPLVPIAAAVGRAVVGAAVGFIARQLAKRAARKAAERAARKAKRDADRKADKDAKRDEQCKTCKPSQEERRQKLEEDAGVTQQTKGKTKHGELPGGMKRADQEFDNLEPKDIKTIPTDKGNIRVGTLENGDKVTVRPTSSAGKPTLEIRRPNGRGIEIRFPE